MERVSSELLRCILLRLVSSDENDEDLSEHVVAFMRTSKALRALLTDDVLRATYGLGRFAFGLGRWDDENEREGFVDMTSSDIERVRKMTSRASKLMVLCGQPYVDDAGACEELLRVLSRHSNVSLRIDHGNVDRAPVFPPMAGLRMLHLTGFREAAVAFSAPSSCFPALEELELDDVSVWRCLRSRVPGLVRLSLYGEISSDEGHDAFVWETEMEHVPKLQRFEMELSSGACIDDLECFQPVVITVPILKSRTPALAYISLGVDWYLSSTAVALDDEDGPGPSLDPDLFLQIEHLKLGRLRWTRRAYERGVDVSELQHLKHFTLTAESMDADSLADVGAMKSLETLTLLLDGFILDGGEDGAALDLEPLCQLPRLRCLTLSKPFEYSETTWGPTDDSMLVAKGCTVVRDDDEDEDEEED